MVRWPKSILIFQILHKKSALTIDWFRLEKRILHVDQIQNRQS